MSPTLDIPVHPSIPLLRQKIGWLCELIRWLVAAYIVWILYLNLSPIFVKGAAETAKEWTANWNLKEGSITANGIYMNVAIVMISWASAALMGFAVWRLMSSYLAGDIFSAGAASRLRLVGTTGLAATLIDIAIRPFMLGVMSTDILKQISLSGWISPVDLMYGLISLFVLSLGHIQRTAAAISDEHRQFV